MTLSCVRNCFGQYVYQSLTGKKESRCSHTWCMPSWIHPLVRLRCPCFQIMWWLLLGRTLNENDGLSSALSYHLGASLHFGHRAAALGVHQLQFTWLAVTAKPVCQGGHGYGRTFLRQESADSHLELRASAVHLDLSDQSLGLLSFSLKQSLAPISYTLLQKKIIIHPHQRCGYSDSPFARIYFFHAAGSGNELEGLTTGARTSCTQEKYTFLLWKNMLRTSDRIKKTSWICWKR